MKNSTLTEGQETRKSIDKYTYNSARDTKTTAKFNSSISYQKQSPVVPAQNKLNKSLGESEKFSYSASSAYS